MTADLKSKFDALVNKMAPIVQSTYNMDSFDGYEYTQKALSALTKVKVCSRCAGSGRCGPQQVFSGICFKCQGARLTGGSISSFLPVEKAVSSDPSLLTKWIDRKLKSEERAKQRKAEKHIAHRNAVKVLQEKCLSTLNADDRLLVETEFARIFADWKESAENPNYVSERRNTFINDICCKFDAYGMLSEKQLNAVVAAIKRDAARSEKLKDARKFEAGRFYDDVIATVTKIEEVTVQATSWIISTTNKVTLIGNNAEHIIVKTNRDKHIQEFKNSMENKKPIQIVGTCKWVAPEGSVSVFTSMGMKILKVD